MLILCISNHGISMGPVFQSSFRLLCILVVLLVALLANDKAASEIIQASDKIVPEIDLAGKSYALNAIVTILEGDKLVRYDIEELHSAWQQRTSLKYSISDTGNRPADTQQRPGPWIPRTGTFYANNRQEVLLLDNRDKSYCQRKDAQFVNQVFNLNLLSDSSIGGAVGQQHLIGASRLLAYIQAHRGQFELLVLNEERMTFWKDEPMGPYSFTTLLIYRKGANENLAHGLPRVVIYVRDKFSIIYDFTRVILLPERETRFGSAAGVSNLLSEQYQSQHDDDSIMFDLFAWPRATGCSKETMAEVSQTSDMASLASSADEHRFSFAAKLSLSHLDEPMEMLVGYEPLLSLLKVERTSRSSSTEILVDYQNDRSFHILKRRTSDTSVIFDKILHTQEDLSCVVTQVSAINAITESRQGPPNLGPLLLGAQRLYYLGFARVRGVEARSYEAYDCEWPVWFEQPTIYKDESGQASVSSRPGGGGGLYRRSIAAGPAQSPKRKLNFMLICVYYFSRTGEEEQEREQEHKHELLDSRLLLLEVFKVTRDTHRLLDATKIHIYDFSWQLDARSPGNKRWEDFFSLGDQCLASPNRVETSPFSIASAANQYVNINLLLEDHPDPNPNPDSEPEEEQEQDHHGWLEESTRRNLALIAAARDHCLPSNMIYNLESRFPLEGPRRGGHNTSNQGQGRLMAVTMEAAERTRDVARVIYLGAANFKWGYLYYEKFQVFMSFSMQSCSMLAAHQRRETLFAFDTSRSCCFILGEDTLLKAGGVQQWIIDQAFNMREEGLLEVYKVQHQARAMITANDYFSSLVQHRDRLVNSNLITLTDPISLIAPQSNKNNNNNKPAKSRSRPEVAKVRLTIKQFELNHLDERRPLLNGPSQAGSTSQLVDVNKFPGIGLLADDHQNRLVSLRTTTSVVPGSGSATDEASMLEQSLAAMSFERCQTACLADPGCKSFSTCARNGAIECLLSKVAFNEPHVARQLALVLQKGSTTKGGATIRIELEERADDDEEVGVKSKAQSTPSTATTTIRVKKQASCELHNKLYSHLFKEGEKLPISLAQRVYRPVANLEQCAQLCFEWTTDQLRKWSAGSGGGHEDGRDESKANGTARAAAKAPILKANSNALCDQFFYVDHSLVVELGHEMHNSQSERAIDYMLGKQQTGGYCLFNKALDEQLEQDQSPGSKAIGATDVAQLAGEAKFSVHEYKFDVKSLFERQFGWSLVQSPKTREEQRAYDVLFSRWSKPNETSQALEAFGPFLERGDNSGNMMPLVDADKCAQMCFNSDSFVWPACRSFDYIEVTSRRTPFKNTYCAINTVTMRQALDKERFDLVRRGEAQERVSVHCDDTVRVWHFEPRYGLVSGSLDEIYKDEIVQLKKNHNSNGQYSTESSEPRSQTKMGSFTMLCIVLATLVIGLVSGIKLASHIIKAKIRSTTNDIDSLVDIVERKTDQL